MNKPIHTPEQLQKRREYNRRWRAQNLERERARCREDKRRRYAANPDKYRKAMREWNASNSDHVYFASVKRRYGISKAEFETVLAKQNYCCAICHEPLKKGRGGRCVDHCHDSNDVCGILCGRCNVALGCLKHSAGIAISAAEYLNRTRRSCV